MAIHLKCTAAGKDAVFFAYLVAIPPRRFSSGNAFSTRCRSRYKYLSYSRCFFQFLRGGITRVIPSSASLSTKLSLSYPLSASKFPASIPSTSLQACEQSATLPAVINILTGIPCASTARWSLLLSPLLCGPYPDCLLVRLSHGNEL